MGNCLSCTSIPPPPHLAPPPNQFNGYNYTCPGNQHSGRNAGGASPCGDTDGRHLQLQAHDARRLPLALHLLPEHGVRAEQLRAVQLVVGPPGFCL
jgi:hypothetical protein